MNQMTRDAVVVEADKNDISKTTEYESPRVESVLTPEEMEREILYAGGGGTGVVN